MEVNRGRGEGTNLPIPCLDLCLFLNVLSLTSRQLAEVWLQLCVYQILASLPQQFGFFSEISQTHTFPLPMKTYKSRNEYVSTWRLK
uniref:Uncharacterized protein n=1 Tax=Mus musculus TaxID=10090 RepID=Q3V3Q0_MOUSE|nr:unnamed protein product [Mus musculus]